MFGPARVRFPALALTLGLALAAGCGHAHGSASSTTTPSAQTAGDEARDVDALLKRLDRSHVVESYRIQDERLVVVVNADGWSRLGAGPQDALKRSLWEAWAASYVRRNGPATGRVFLSVEDAAGNDLGSYFAH
jgi:hypothetical protein